MSNNLEWRDVATQTTTLVTDIAVETYELTGLTPGEEYEFRVQETDGVETTPWSEWVQFVALGPLPQYFEDFSDVVLGESPSMLALEFNGPITMEAESGNLLGSSSSKIRIRSPLTTKFGRTGISWKKGELTLDDEVSVSVLGEWAATSGGAGNYLGALLYGGGTTDGDRNGYLQIHRNGDHRVFRSDAGTETTIGSAATAAAAVAEHWLELDTRFSQLAARSWPFGTAQPLAAQILSNESPLLSGGWPGISVLSNDDASNPNIWIHAISVGLQGAAAPKSVDDITAAGFSASYFNETAATSHTFEIDIEGVPNRYLIVPVRFSSGITTSGVTCGGVAMTELLSHSFDNSYKLYGLVNPPAGPQTIEITTSAARGIRGACAIAYQNVDQTNPVSFIDDAYSGGAVTVTAAAGELAVLCRSDLRVGTAGDFNWVSPANSSNRAHAYGDFTGGGYVHVTDAMSPGPSVSMNSEMTGTSDDAPRNFLLALAPAPEPPPVTGEDGAGTVNGLSSMIGLGSVLKSAGGVVTAEAVVQGTAAVDKTGAGQASSALAVTGSGVTEVSVDGAGSAAGTLTTTVTAAATRDAAGGAAGQAAVTGQAAVDKNAAGAMAASCTSTGAAVVESGLTASGSVTASCTVSAQAAVDRQGGGVAVSVSTLTAEPRADYAAGGIAEAALSVLSAPAVDKSGSGAVTASGVMTGGAVTAAVTDGAGAVTAVLTVSGEGAKTVDAAGTADCYSALTVRAAVDRSAAGASAAKLSVIVTPDGGTTVRRGYLYAREVAIKPAVTCYTRVTYSLSADFEFTKASEADVVVKPR